MNEILMCIKLIKMYAWENSFAKSVAGKYQYFKFVSNISILKRHGQNKDGDSLESPSVSMRSTFMIE